MRDVVRAFLRDRISVQRFGPLAPRYAEEIFLNPSEIANELVEPISRSKSGEVMPMDWEPETRPLLDNPKVMYCLKRWRDGEDWEDSGAIQYHLEAIRKYGKIDHCRSINDVMRRLQALDKVKRQVLEEGRLRSASDVRRYSFRESGGILVHLGPKGLPIFGCGGQHRLGLALAIGLVEIPCQLGVVHPTAIESLSELRKHYHFGRRKLETVD
ncbi:hypothetical protein [Pararhodobacter oceanensis]|uniref:hypothetical protein n=1 Tax=Pararhodobacter oceanensis TaxID=2172121 RepID=UPI003A94AFCD